MGLKIRLPDMPAGNAERNNHDKSGSDEAEPVRQGYFKGSGARVAAECYYGKYKHCERDKDRGQNR